ncbi:hypothetical protein [Halobacillus sp. A5]|uniref:hypothetical protein n=1 Tax=Halobacillus sp. A5 TaxID=2880263 RepID=UPI0020A62BEF|nr:hypothetical protein [Halobacillus sp. A5]MCP3027029.1 hypothetical protein [Halobacillus sp. A5]
MTEDSITLVKNEDVLPLEADDEMFVTGPSIGSPDLLADLLNNEGVETQAMAQQV